MPWSCRIGLELAAQVSHVYAQVVRVLDVRRPPHFTQKLAMGQYLSGVRDQMRKQSELDGR